MWDVPVYNPSTRLVIHFPVLANCSGKSQNYRISTYTVIQYLEIVYTDKEGKPVTTNIQKQLPFSSRTPNRAFPIFWVFDFLSVPSNFTARIKMQAQSKQSTHFLRQGRAVNIVPKPLKKNADTTFDKSDSARPLPEVGNTVSLYWR